MSIFGLLYSVAVYGLSLLGLHAMALSVLYLLLGRRTRRPPTPPQRWPTVTVQLPIYNERYVVERLIDAVCVFDYPADRLSIQVLDDSSDETAALVQARAEAHRARGVNITVRRRAGRAGYKAGALAEGLPEAPGEYLAVFDADFVPPSDFLRRLIPYLEADPSLGLVQARWGHLNATAGLLTRAQAMALDGHFVVEQGARSRLGLLLNFNGSAGIWRRVCIESAGGWQGDTLAEDLDLSYRAQLKGWHLLYVPDVIAPAEIPPLVLAFKRQQFRWAKGSIQVLRKLGGRLWASDLPPHRRVAGLLHLSGYFAHLLMILLLLASLPVMLDRELARLPLSLLSLAGFGPPLLYAISQWAAYPDWGRRLLHFPALMCIGVGVALNNGVAVLEALGGRPSEFQRTPKVAAESGAPTWPVESSYRLWPDWTTWGELVLGIYALVAIVVSLSAAPGLTPFLVLYAVGFFYVGLLSLWQVYRPGSRSRGRRSWSAWRATQAAQPLPIAATLPVSQHPTRGSKSG